MTMSQAHDSRPSRKEHLEIGCEICYWCSKGGPMWSPCSSYIISYHVNQKSDYDDLYNLCKPML